MARMSFLDIEAYRYEREYGQIQGRLINSIRNNRQSDRFCVVIHLYYTENWSLFLKRLKNLSNTSFDIVVTIPKHNEGFGDTIRSSFPDAHIVAVPNRGRDVLPFIKVAGVLNSLGYEYVLKFHSKKSTHWKGGQEWLEGMMERLLPASRNSIDTILSTLAGEETGVVGPEGVYYPLTINFPANGSRIDKVIRMRYSPGKAHEVLQKRRKEYGFFGGTMFWARLDAIEDLLGYPVRQFESESGQVDGTMAHALERLFCLVPEMDGREMYEVDRTGRLAGRSYMSDNIPEWSKDHDK